MAFITAAKPAAEIMIKPIIAIICTPLVNTSCVSFHAITPPKVNTIKPASAPMIIDPVNNCTANAATMPTPAIAICCLLIDELSCCTTVNSVS
ncbi:Uncharacterised protein [Vibrio cholerae]|uniref:Uncharacterized protein n=1 Tax=Vibrio cholerae TaxID=666 RepID=A0A655QG55_VIBCL|nr:Uncharacterised protein [Vibrio cholerae]